MLVRNSVVIILHQFLILSIFYTQAKSADVSSYEEFNPVIELNDLKANDSRVVIGVLVEEKMYKDFQKAAKLFTQNRTNVSIVYRVVKNDPYDALRTVCDQFVSVHGLVFVCEEPCSKVTSFVGFIGLSGILVERRSEEHTTLFMEAPISFLDIKPPLHLQNEALLELMKQFQWQTFCLIHDNDKHTAHLVENLQQIMSKNVKISQKLRLDGLNSTIDNGLRMAYGKIRVFVLFCRRHVAEIVLDRAKRQQLTTTEHAWIVGEMVLENHEVPDSFPIGLLGIEYVYENENVGHIIDAMNTVHYGIDELVRNDVTWLDTPTGNCVESSISTRPVSPLYEAMRKVSFMGRTGQVAFTEDGFRAASRYNFMNLQQKRENGQLFWQNVGYSENGNVMLEQIVWPGGVVHTPSGVPRVRLRVVMYEVAPLLYVRNLNASIKDCQQGMKCTLVTTDKREEPRCCYGLCIDLISLLSQDLDLEPEIRTIEKARAGSYKNGRWSGIIGSVLYGEADMAMSSISITEERSKYIDFSAPFMHTGSVLLVAKRHGSFTGDGFLKPFELEAWLLLFAVLYIVAFVIFIFESKNPGLERTKHKNYAGKFDIHTSIWLIYSRLFSGNLDAHTPRFISSRVVLGSWSFSSLMVVALYTANLAAFMVQKEEAHYIDGINDSKIQRPSNNLKFTTILETSVGRFFKNNFPHIYRFMEKQHKVNLSKEGVKAVLEGKIDAFIWETVSLQQYTSKDSGCRLLTVGKPFDQTGYAAVFQKGSKWTKNVTEMILKYQTSSKSSELEKKWQKGFCHDKSSSVTIEHLGIYNLAGVFYLLLAGIGLSIAVLLAENVLYAIGIRLPRKSSTSSIIAMANEDRLKLQKEVAGIGELLENGETTDNRLTLLSKMEQELQQTLRELQTLQEQTQLSFQTSPFQGNEFQMESDRSHEHIEDMTLVEMKKIIDTLNDEINATERESVV